MNRIAWRSGRLGRYPHFLIVHYDGLLIYGADLGGGVVLDRAPP